MRTWRRRKDTLGIFSLYAKRYKSVNISINNNTNLNLFEILFNYILLDRLSQKTISRYCPFKHQQRRHLVLVSLQIFSPWSTGTHAHCVVFLRAIEV